MNGYYEVIGSDENDREWYAIGDTIEEANQELINMVNRPSCWAASIYAPNGQQIANEYGVQALCIFEIGKELRQQAVQRDAFEFADIEADDLPF